MSSDIQIQLFLQMVANQPTHVREHILTILQNNEMTMEQKIEVISGMLRPSHIT